MEARECSVIDLYDCAYPQRALDYLQVLSGFDCIALRSVALMLVELIELARPVCSAQTPRVTRVRLLCEPIVSTSSARLG